VAKPIDRKEKVVKQFKIEQHLRLDWHMLSSEQDLSSDQVTEPLGNKGLSSFLGISFYTEESSNSWPERLFTLHA
jgi:hypothetical protein